MPSLEGRQLGNYTVTRRIRSGGMGAVYEGRQRTAFDRRVAIKVILGTYATDPDMRRRFAREAKTIARLHHPHILPLIEFGDEQGVLYLVMPFIEGGTLTGYLRRHLPDVHEVSTIFLQVLDAVEYAHDEGLIHRDIKSSNVLLESRRNGPPYAYLADFGLVRTIQQAELESSYAGTPIPLDQVPGTPQYMAPEQTLGIVTPSTDIYALGVLLYQMLTGELPYNDPDDIEVIKMQLYAPPPNPRDSDASIPAEIGALVTRAMAKRPEQRFANVGEFREAFIAALDRPVEQVEEHPFEIEQEDFVSDESAQPAPQEPQPPRSQRLSQHLRMPPEPIEFAGPQASPRRPRITDDQSDETPRRPRIASDPAEAARRPRAAEAPPEAPAAGRRPHIPGEQTEQLAPARRQRVTEEPDGPGPGRRLHRTDEPLAGSESPDASARRPRTTEDRGESGRADGLRARLAGNRSVPLALSQQRLQAEKIEPAGLRRRSQPTGGRRRFRPTIVGGLVIAVLLILLLLLPRLFGVPLLGSSPVARILLTVKTSTVHDTFLITASPQTTQENASTRVISDRYASGSASGNRTVTTSGLRNNGGTQASGTLHFDNSGQRSVSVSSGFTFVTDNNVQVRLTADILVPGRSAGQDGTVDAPAESVETGDIGNIQANALDSPCCGGQVVVSNPAAFSGGSDGSVTHSVAQNDLDGVKNELTPGLRQQAAQQLSNHLQPGEVEASSPDYNVSVTSDQPVGATADHVTVTVTVTATALVYNMHAVDDLARQLLDSEANQSPTLGPGYQLRGPLNVATPTIEQQNSNGQLYLSVSASGLWSYTVTAHDENLWRQAIKGASATLAQSYLSTQAGITNVHIDLPFGTDHLPTDETQIVFTVS